MEKSMPKLDSHIIDYFLNMAEHMEEQLDEQTYASVKRIFNKDILMVEEEEDYANGNKQKLKIGAKNTA